MRARDDQRSHSSLLSHTPRLAPRTVTRARSPLRSPDAPAACAGLVFETDDKAQVRVAEVTPGTQAASSGLIFVGDLLRQTSAVFGDELWDVNDLKRTLSAIHLRSGDVSLVLERPPRRSGATRQPSPQPCDSVGSGKVGACWTVGRGGVSFVSFSLDEGCIADPQPLSLQAPRASPLAAVVADSVPPDAADELRAAQTAVVTLHPRLLALSRPVTPRGLALLCAERSVGAVLSLLQPFELGRSTATMQAAAAAAGARRICVPLPDGTRRDICAVLPAAAAAAARLAAWTNAPRAVLLTASDPLALVAPTVAAATLHWHWGFSLKEASLAVPTADLGIIKRAGAEMLAALHPDSTKASLQSAPPPLELHSVRFSWQGKATRVEVVGDVVGIWEPSGAVPMAAVADSSSVDEWAVVLVLPRGHYEFKFLLDGNRWVVGGAHTSSTDAKGNLNNYVSVGATGAGHTAVSGAAAAQWGESAMRLALVRGCARRLALSLDVNTLLTQETTERAKAERLPVQQQAGTVATSRTLQILR